MNKSTDFEQVKSGLKAFFKYSKEWALNEQECLKLLGEPDSRTYERWLTNVVTEGDVSEALLYRLSQLINIYKILCQKHSIENQRHFLRNNTPSGAFKEKSPLVHMMGDYKSLILVRNYLESERCF